MTTTTADTITTTPRRRTRWAPPQKPDGSSFIKWNSVPIGFELAGTWLGPVEGDFGPIGTLRREDGVVVRFGLPAILADRLDTMPVGAYLWITYRGMAGPESRRFHLFDCDVDPMTVPGLKDAPIQENVPF